MRGACHLGARGVALGVALHCLVAFVWSTLFVLTLASFERLRRVADWPGGAFGAACAHGPAIWLVMSLVIIPLATGRPPTFAFRWWVHIFAHVPFVTPPLIFAVPGILLVAY